MDPVQDQLVKDVAELKQHTSLQITEGRVRELVKEAMDAAKPPPETPKARPFRLSSRIKKSQTQKKS